MLLPPEEASDTLTLRLSRLLATIKVKIEQERFDGFAAQYELSSKECEILQLVLAGRSNPEMAANLYISESTVKFHIHNLLKKTASPWLPFIGALSIFHYLIHSDVFFHHERSRE